MNNQEPVAWSCWNEDMPLAIITIVEPDKYDWQSIKPLYTHPHKDLSDEEIEQISHRYHYTYNPDYVGFARAIIKSSRGEE